jgi:16S rRNA (cytosine967-C5)-methyltransferase
MKFSKMFLDAPCTATGIIRRHPDVKWSRDETSAGKMADIQKRMLKSAYSALASGGRLVYSVCSIEQKEGPDVINSFLADTPTARRVNVAEGRAELLPYQSEDGDLAIFPGDGGMDGFFASIVTRA